jgi:hypothetical protein
VARLAFHSRAHEGGLIDNARGDDAVLSDSRGHSASVLPQFEGDWSHKPSHAEIARLDSRLAESDAGTVLF